MANQVDRLQDSLSVGSLRTTLEAMNALAVGVMLRGLKTLQLCAVGFVSKPKNCIRGSNEYTFGLMTPSPNFSPNFQTPVVNQTPILG